MVREALAAYVAAPAAARRRLPKITGMFESGHTDPSSRVDELLTTDRRHFGIVRARHAERFRLRP